MKTIFLAQEEARRLGRYYLGTEHILLGLIGEGTGVAAKTLKAQGATLNTARIKVEDITGRSTVSSPLEIPFSLRAKRLGELAWEQARTLGHNYIASEHLLLGLIRQGSGVGVQVLDTMGIDLTTLRENVLRQLSLPQEQVAMPKAIGTAAAISTDTTKTCPNCAESIKPYAMVCHFCNYGVSNEYFADCKLCKERIRKGALKCKHCLSLISEEGDGASTSIG